VDRVYLERPEPPMEVCGRGVARLESGNHEACLLASNLAEAPAQWQRLRIACPEKIAFRFGNINAAKVAELATVLGKSEYGTYLLNISGESHGISNRGLSSRRHQVASLFSSVAH